MSPHPSDQVVADLIRHARLGATARPLPTRTRPLGEHTARQHSVGSLVVETARADSGVSEDVAQARREMIARELERRRLVDAAEEARRQADVDREHAERERDAAVHRAREHGGPEPDFLTLALIAAVTLEITDHDLVDVLDAAITDTPDLSVADTADLAGEPRVGLNSEQLATELEAAGGPAASAEGLPQTGPGGVTPAVLVGQSPDPSTDSTPAVSVGDGEPESSPEVG